MLTYAVNEMEEDDFLQDADSWGYTKFLKVRLLTITLKKICLNKLKNVKGYRQGVKEHGQVSEVKLQSSKIFNQEQKIKVRGQRSG